MKTREPKHLQLVPEDATSEHGSTLPERLAALLLGGDEAAALGLLRQSMQLAASPLEIAEELIAPAMRHIGALWERGAIGVADEHLASRLVESAVHVLRSEAKRALPLGERALVACLPLEWHALGARLFAALLHLDGWEVDDLGADTPAAALLMHAAARQPSLVVLVGVYGSARSELPGAIAALQALEQRPFVVIGGAAAGWPEAAGADLRAMSLSEGLTAARELIERQRQQEEAYSLDLQLAAMGARLQRLRRDRGWSQSELAESAGLDRTYVSGVERGKQNPTIGVLMRLATALGVRLEQLLFG